MQLSFCVIHKMFLVAAELGIDRYKTVFVMNFLPKSKPDINVDTIQTVVKQGDVQNRYARKTWKTEIPKKTVISF